MILSGLTDQISPSGIRKIFNQSLAYTDVVNFTLGEPDFTASDNVAEAGCRAIREGQTKYSTNAGILPLRTAIAGSLKKELDLDYDPKSQIVVTVGGMGALYLAMKTILNPGDEVVLPSPYWTNHAAQIEMCGGVPVYVNCREENDFVLDVDDLGKAISPKTKAVVLNSPSNPTGSVIDRGSLLKISKIAKRNDLLVISDEVYKKIVFDGNRYESIACMPGMQERTVMVDSFSKTYAMTGWRVGYAAGPEKIIKNITKFQENVASCAPMPSQYAALEALQGPQDHVKNMVAQYEKRRDYLVDRLNRMDGISCRLPRATFYAFANIKGLGMTSEKFAYSLLDQKQVAVIPGTAFGGGGEGYVRISYATSMEQIEKGMDRLEAYIRDLGAGRL